MWEKAIEDTKQGKNNDKGERGYKGSQGTPGGKLRLFLNLSSAPSPTLAKLTATGSGGGDGGPGGSGKNLKCGDHGGHEWAMNGDKGPQGDRGGDGRIELHLSGSPAGGLATEAVSGATPKPAILEQLSAVDWAKAAADERAKHP